MTVNHQPMRQCPTMAARANGVPLTLKQEAFIEALVRTGNQTTAAEAAGYSPKHAYSTGNKLMRLPHVKAAYLERKATYHPHVSVSVEDVIREAAAIAFVDATAIFTPEGELRPVHQWPAICRRSIASIEVVLKNAYAGDNVIDRVLKVRWHDKSKALELLAKHLGMLVERREVGAPGSFAALSDEELASRIASAAGRLAQLTAGPKALERGESGADPAKITAPNEQESPQVLEGTVVAGNGPG